MKILTLIIFCLFGITPTLGNVCSNYFSLLETRRTLLAAKNAELTDTQNASIAIGDSIRRREGAEPFDQAFIDRIYDGPRLTTAQRNYADRSSKLYRKLSENREKQNEIKKTISELEVEINLLEKTIKSQQVDAVPVDYLDLSKKLKVLEGELREVSALRKFGMEDEAYMDLWWRYFSPKVIGGTLLFPKRKKVSFWQQDLGNQFTKMNYFKDLLSGKTVPVLNLRTDQFVEKSISEDIQKDPYKLVNWFLDQLKVQRKNDKYSKRVEYEIQVLELIKNDEQFKNLVTNLGTAKQLDEKIRLLKLQISELKEKVPQ